MDDLLGHLETYDNSYHWIAETQVGNGFAGGDVHGFLITSRNTALIILYHAAEWDLTPIGGSTYVSAIDGIIKEIGTP